CHAYYCTEWFAGLVYTIFIWKKNSRPCPAAKNWSLTRAKKPKRRRWSPNISTARISRYTGAAIAGCGTWLLIISGGCFGFGFDAVGAVQLFFAEALHPLFAGF